MVEYSQVIKGLNLRPEVGFLGYSSVTLIKDGDEKTILRELKKCVLLCPECHAAKTLEKGEYINKDKEPARHNSIHMYKNRGCRCDKCRMAMRQYLLSKK